MSTHITTLVHQSETLALATNWGEVWDADSLGYVAAHTDEMSDADLAFALGRSLWAISTIQKRLRAEGIEALMAEVGRRRERGNDAANVAVCPTCYVALPATKVCDYC